MVGDVDRRRRPRRGSGRRRRRGGRPSPRPGRRPARAARSGRPGVRSRPSTAVGLRVRRSWLRHQLEVDPGPVGVVGGVLGPGERRVRGEDDGPGALAATASSSTGSERVALRRQVGLQPPGSAAEVGRTPCRRSRTPRGGSPPRRCPAPWPARPAGGRRAASRSAPRRSGTRTARPAAWSRGRPRPTLRAPAAGTAPPATAAVASAVVTPSRAPLST